MATNRQVTTEEFFASHPVFSLDEATRAWKPSSGRRGAVYRLKHHVEAGRLKRLAREVYAVVPLGQSADQLQADAFLVALAIRPEGVFSHHSALELLGVAHSTWSQCTVFSDRRRPAMTLEGRKVLFLEHPRVLQANDDVMLGTRKVERRGRLLHVTGPERAVVEGFRRLDLVGGLAELVTSAGGFPTLDLEILEAVLDRYSIAYLWAMAGWFLERHRKAFHVSDEYLSRLESRRPRAAQYLVRRRHGGTLDTRWNIILPAEASHLSEPDER